METGNEEQPYGKCADLGAFYALISAVEARKPSSVSHNRNVSTYAVALAEAIGLSPDQVGIVGVAALLHDIGNIGIPNGVLMKKDKLIEEEWKVIRAHPELGAKIIKDGLEVTPSDFGPMAMQPDPKSRAKIITDAGEPKLNDESWNAFQTDSELWAPIFRNTKAGRVNLAYCADVILHHHERWDGGGYPRGLKGEQIPIEARVITIAESFDAMAIGRPYRPAFSIKDTVGELKKCAGSQFDPKLVDVFVGMIEARPRK
jgi:HD-GYP domain-containing protein (c-di-GMP phosphodiesterase class II)